MNMKDVNIVLPWARNDGQGWFTDALLREQSPQRLFTSNLVEQIAPGFIEVSVRLETKSLTGNATPLHHAPITDCPYTYQIGNSDQKVHFVEEVWRGIGALPPLLWAGIYPLDRGAHYPVSATLPFLTWFEGVYDAVYIALNPFRRPPSVDKNAVLRFRPYAPGDTFVRWDTILRQAGLSDYADLHRATNIALSINDAYKHCDRPELTRALKDLSQKMPFFYPSEDTFGIPMINKLIDLLQRAEIHTVDLLTSCYDEFKDIPVEGLLENTAIPHENLSQITTSNRSLLLEVDYDEHFTIIAGRSELLRKLHINEHFEGFWADELTCSAWWMTESERAYFHRHF